MGILKNFKQTMFATVTALALGVVAFAGVEAQAAVAEKTVTYKTVSEVGNSVELYGATNVKINGKKYSKGSIKKKVKTVVFNKNPRAVCIQEPYYNSEKAYGNDSIAYNAATSNFKYVGTSDFKLDFLKEGKYKVTYDTYETDDATYTAVPGTDYSLVTPNVTKVHHVVTYKVVKKNAYFKSIALGKSKVTWTYKNSGSKFNYQRVIKNRYLKGTSGKLVVKTNKPYSVTSAFVVTYDATGAAVVTPTSNKATIAYGAGYSMYDKKYEYKDSLTGAVTFTNVYGKKSQYKPTEVYFGLDNTFTGAKTTYAVSTTTVYVTRKNPDGTIFMDENFNFAYDPVTATVITKTYPVRKFNKTANAYVTVDVVAQNIVMPGATSIFESSYYYVPVVENGVTTYESKRNYGFETVTVGGLDVNSEVYENTYAETGYDANGNSIDDAFETSLGSCDTSYTFYAK